MGPLQAAHRCRRGALRWPHGRGHHPHHPGRLGRPHVSTAPARPRPAADARTRPVGPAARCGYGGLDRRALARGRAHGVPDDGCRWRLRRDLGDHVRAGRHHEAGRSAEAPRRRRGSAGSVLRGTARRHREVVSRAERRDHSGGHDPRSREAVRYRRGQRAPAQSAAGDARARRPGFPHRSLPRAFDRAEPARRPLRQPPPRKRLVGRRHRFGRHRLPRAPRPRGTRGLLRRCRRSGRHDPESPAAGHGVRHDGAPGIPQPTRSARRHLRVLRATHVRGDDPVRNSRRARYTAGDVGDRHFSSYVDEPGSTPRAAPRRSPR